MCIYVHMCMCVCVHRLGVSAADPRLWWLARTWDGSRKKDGHNMWVRLKSKTGQNTWARSKQKDGHQCVCNCKRRMATACGVMERKQSISLFDEWFWHLPAIVGLIVFFGQFEWHSFGIVCVCMRECMFSCVHKYCALIYHFEFNMERAPRNIKDFLFVK